MKNILDKYPEISTQLKLKIASSHFWKIKLKFSQIKNKHIKRLKSRDDVNQILVMGTKSKNEDLAAIEGRFDVEKVDEYK